jgi:hypothetical protein
MNYSVINRYHNRSRIARFDARTCYNYRLGEARRRRYADAWCIFLL